MAPKRKRILTGSWSQLPIDIVDNIMKKLDLPVDVVSFSGVCKPWRYVALGFHMSLYCKLPMHHFVPKRKSSPLPMLLHPGCEGPNTHQFYSLNERKIYGGFYMRELSNKWIVGSGAGWLVMVDTTDPEVNLLNPLTGKKIPLPHFSTLPTCDIVDDYDDLTAYWYIRKVIVCSYQGSFLIVALVSDSKTIRFCRIGDSKWTRLEISPLHLEDIIMHNSKLYAINRYGALFEIDIDIAGPAKVTMVAMRCPSDYGRYFLVDLCGELVLIERRQWMLKRKRSSSMTSGFLVFKLVDDESGYFGEYESEAGMKYPEKVGHSWVRLKNLGHHMVFIGYNHSLSLDSRVYPRCKGNCIYFADCRRDDDDDITRTRGMSKKLYHDIGIYRMKHRKVKYFENFCNASSPMNMVWLSPNFSTGLEMQMIPR